MKLLAWPKSEVTIIPNDSSIAPRTFTYYLNETYPSKEMSMFIEELNSNAKKIVKIFPPLIELSVSEFNDREREKNRFLLLSNGMPLYPKEDIELDGFKFFGSTFKSAILQDNGTYHCEMTFVRVESLNDDA